MSTQVAVTLPDEVYQRAERLAQLTSRDVADVLADTIALSLPLLSPQADVLKPVTGLSDEEILALSTLEMEPAQDQRLSLLLDRQQAGELSDTERTELLALMQLYQEGLLRKTQGCVRRSSVGDENRWGRELCTDIKYDASAGSCSGQGPLRVLPKFTTIRLGASRNRPYYPISKGRDG